MRTHHFLPICAAVIVGSLYIESPVERFGHSPYADPAAYFSWYPAPILLLMWAIYTVATKFLYSAKLASVHIFSTVLILAFLYITPLLHINQGNGFAGAPRRYFDYEGMGIIDMFEFFAKPVQAFILALFATQLVFLLNLALGIKVAVTGTTWRSGW